MEIAGIDPEAVARRVASYASLGSRIAANYFVGLGKEDLGRLVMTPQMQETMRSIRESVAATIRSSMAPQLADFNALERVSADLVKSADLDEFTSRISAQIVNSDVMEKFGRAWGKALSDSIAVKPGTLAAIREAQNGVTRG
ncbi:hypothetical protein [Tessaracoccus sp. ZS01]|uniref:hypothetical protein n=1 Tax=Tessaracoccus sp. ZS01 TaxID=1906324 RepID=UPI00096FD868|nr:hypothetical protein [Tessaracoccus sp. ZS01]MCG6568687.1 hypothetical protein [Tessaracoccus sp. ZS01]OMG51947.1 hypothetical protein BJN44_13800 [Tessaracoccus sp. ZS01]